MISSLSIKFYSLISITFSLSLLGLSVHNTDGFIRGGKHHIVLQRVLEFDPQYVNPKVLGYPGFDTELYII
jgi:hypothetical protein